MPLVLLRPKPCDDRVMAFLVLRGPIGSTTRETAEVLKLSLKAVALAYARLARDKIVRSEWSKPAVECYLLQEARYWATPKEIP